MRAAQQSYAFVCHQQLTLHHCNRHIYACSSAVVCPCLPSTADTALLQSSHLCRQLSCLMPLSAIKSYHCITAIITSMHAAQQSDELCRMLWPCTILLHSRCSSQPVDALLANSKKVHCGIVTHPNTAAINLCVKLAQLCSV